MKIWNASEIKTAKVIMTVDFKRAGMKVVTKPIVIRPSRMSTTHLQQLNKIISRYGKDR